MLTMSTRICMWTLLILSYIMTKNTCVYIKPKKNVCNLWIKKEKNQLNDLFKIKW